MTTLGTSVKIPALSREYLYVDVDVPRGMSLAAVQALGVSWAFLADKVSRPVTADWVAGDWEPDRATARVLIGPGGVKTLTAQTYYAWLRLDGAVERPVRSVGPVQVI